MLSLSAAMEIRNVHNMEGGVVVNQITHIIKELTAWRVGEVRTKSIIFRIFSADEVVDCTGTGESSALGGSLGRPALCTAGFSG